MKDKEGKEGMWHMTKEKGHENVQGRVGNEKNKTECTSHETRKGLWDVPGRG